MHGIFLDNKSQGQTQFKVMNGRIYCFGKEAKRLSLCIYRNTTYFL